MTPRLISFHYVLKDRAGKVLDSSDGGDPMTFVEGVGQIIPGLEEGLKALKIGDKKHIMVEADQAYGNRDERLVMEVPLGELPEAEKVTIGMAYDIELSDDASHVFRVTSLNKTHATLDGNHPLAGQDLFFDVEVKVARAATKDEIAEAEAEEDEDDHENCGHDHGPEGHTH